MAWVLQTNLEGPKGTTGTTGTAGADGKGFTGGSYGAGTGIVTFTSADGLGFATSDLRGASGAKGDPGNAGPTGKGWTGASYNGSTGKVTFTSDDAIGFVTDDLRGVGITVSTSAPVGGVDGDAWVKKNGVSGALDGLLVMDDSEWKLVNAPIADMPIVDFNFGGATSIDPIDLQGLLNPDEGTVFFDGITYETGANRYLITINADASLSSFNNGIMLRDQSANGIGGYIRGNGTGTQTAANSQHALTRVFVAYSWSDGAQSICIDGGDIYSATAALYDEPLRYLLTRSGSGVDVSINRVAIYRKKLSDAMLKVITTR
ncbi:hypothetical protein H0A71_06170 [Alcaligenaceae bacterium]|nr:hypothetical protein [Alcaligenaceae bacterium]